MRHLFSSYPCTGEGGGYKLHLPLPLEEGEGGGFVLVQLTHWVLKTRVVNIYVLSLVLGCSQFQQITVMVTVNEDLAIPFLLHSLGLC